MLSKTHNLVESITYALGPLFHEEPDYKTIQQAIGLVIARIAMATPNRGKEFLELSIIHEYSQKALEELLNIEAEQAAQKALVEQGIGGFAKLFSPSDEETEKDLKDYYQDRCTLEDLQARHERRAALHDIEIIKAEEAKQAHLDTYKEN
jgi:hypothetical protein